MALCALLFAVACAKKDGKKELPPPAGSEPPPTLLAPSASASGVEQTESPDALLATGATHAFKQAELSAKVSGTLRSVDVDEGDLVKKGQVVFRIDGSSAQLQVKQAKTALAAAKVTFSGAELEYKRTRELSAGGAVSSAALDTAKLQYDQAKVAVQQAEVAVSTANKAVGDTVVKSPISGIVAKKLKEVGESVSANAAPVLIVQDISKLEVRVSVPETALGSVKPGDRMRVRVRALGKSYETKVDRINPSVDSSTRTVEIVGLLENPDSDLKAGLLTEVEFPDAERGSAAPDKASPRPAASSAQKLGSRP